MANFVFVLDTYFPIVGGGEVLFKDVCEVLAKRGNVVRVVTGLYKGLKKFEIVNGVFVHRVRCFNSRFLFFLTSISSIFRLIKKADLVHTANFVSAPAAWFACFLRRKKCVLTSHEVCIGKWRKISDSNFFVCFLFNFFEKMIYRLPFYKHVVVSKSTMKNLLRRGVSKSKISVIYNGVDYSHWDPVKFDGSRVRKDLGVDDRFVCLFFGRPTKNKGLRYLIEAVPKISSRIKNFVLLAVVSDNVATLSARNATIDLCRKLGVSDKVIFRKSVDYSVLPGFVKAADCVVVPSLAEGFGFVAAESCAMGVPVVVSDVDSLSEVVSGKFVFSKPGDVGSIAKGVVDVYEGRFEVSPLKKFKKEEMVNGYLGFYGSVLGEGVVV